MQGMRARVKLHLTRCDWIVHDTMKIGYKMLYFASMDFKGQGQFNLNLVWRFI